MDRTSEALCLVAFLALLWVFYAIRTADGYGEYAETSVRCVKLGGEWQKPKWLTPGWCKRMPVGGPKE